jgi:hypothetical protein
MRAGGAHREAVQRIFGTDFARGGITSVWAPHHWNAMLVRCNTCGQIADADKSGGICHCGAKLPEHPAYW